MTAETDLLPMPEGEAIGLWQAWSYDQMQAYARANVLHHTAPLQAEIERLREALEQCITSMLDSGYRADAVVIRAARAALAAYRKQGVSDE